MRTLVCGCASIMLVLGVAHAQTPPTNSPPGPAVTTPRVPDQVVPNHLGNGAVPSPNTQANTTDGTAYQPAKGANSFTENEARHRMEAKGYSNISGLSKDPDGVWVGKAEKNGKTTTVWLDYKGNVGERM